jgi:hypothetical protein
VPAGLRNPKWEIRLTGPASFADVAALTGRSLVPGTLAGAISRLEEAGLIEARISTGRRKPYALTNRGAAVAGAEIERLVAVAPGGDPPATRA